MDGAGGGGMKKNGMSCAAVVTGTLTLVMLNKLPHPLVFFSQSDATPTCILQPVRLLDPDC